VDIPLDDEAFRKRFWSFVDAETGEWIGYRDRDGYGIFTATGPSGQRVKFRAHRVAWALANDCQPPPVVRHECDRPPCCRPACLRGGTQADNIADRDDPARRSRRQRRQRVAAGQHELELDPL